MIKTRRSASLAAHAQVTANLDTNNNNSTTKRKQRVSKDESSSSDEEDSDEETVNNTNANDNKRQRNKKKQTTTTPRSTKKKSTTTSPKLSSSTSISQDQLEEIQEAFDLFKNDNGKIDLGQVKYAFRALGVEPEKADDNNNTLNNTTSPILTSTTTTTTTTTTSTSKRKQNQSDQLTFTAFKDLATKLLPKRDSHSTLEQAFKLFDKDESGKISFEDLKVVAVNLGEECSDDDLREMIEFADTDGDGEINKAEFISLMSAK